MALRQNVLYFVYKLNGKVTEIRSEQISQSKADVNYFDKVDLRRLDQRTLSSLFFCLLHITEPLRAEF